MRHKYDTRALILSRSPFGEASALVTLLTPSFGLVRARVQGLRRPGAKLAPSLTTFSESSVMLVRGKEGWRVTGALLEENWFSQMNVSARKIAARVSGLVLRLAASEVQDDSLFLIYKHFFEALISEKLEALEIIEILTALRVLRVLGLDAGDIPGGLQDFSSPVLQETLSKRNLFISRINHGIVASGL